MEVERAGTLLDEAGCALDADGVRFRVTLGYPPFLADNLGTGAQYIRAQLDKTGIVVDLRPPADFASWAKHIASWDY